MSKKQKTSSAPKTVRNLLLSIVPVFSAVLLIFVVGLVVILVSNTNDRKPSFKGAEDVYFTHEEMQITKDELYTNMKIDYGAAELIRLIDLKLYAKEIEASKNEETNKEIIDFIVDSLFGLESVSELKDTEENQKIWDELIDSLKMNNLLTDEEIGGSTEAEIKEICKVTNTTSKVWEKVIEHYRLQFVRTNWAKDAYVEQWKNNKIKENEEKKLEDTSVLFDEKTLKEKYEAEYEATTYALIIPFATEAEAYAMMKKHGVNTQSSTSINKLGWMNSSYDYNNNSHNVNTETKESFRLSNEEVLTIFYNMYNEVLGYYNVDENGNFKVDESGKRLPIIDITKDIDTSANYNAAFNEAVHELEEKLEDLVVFTNVTLPTAIKLVGGADLSVEIKWEVEANDYVTLNENVLSIVSAENGTKGSFDLSATLTLKVNDKETYSKEIEVEGKTEVSETGKDSEIKVNDVKVLSKYALTTEFMDSFEGDKEPNKFSQFVWKASELSAIDSKLASSLKASDGSLKPIVDNNEYAEFYKSYTVTPIKGTNFYFLAVKFAEVEAPEFESVKAEIEEKLLEELKTDNNASDMIYQRRQDAQLKIYDKYLEAIYDYDYTYFYETTLKKAQSDYKVFENSKKNKKDVVASVVVDGETYEIKAEFLYNSLEEKYGVSVVIDFLNSYMTVGNEKYNPYYNPYTGKENKKVVEELFKGEVSSFRNNFELDYFTYSYLSYYGFIPNFPSSYGWNDFRTDYFGAYTDKDLLVSSSFGGYLYNEALQALKEDVYLTNHKNSETETYDQLLLRLIKDEATKIEEEHYSLNVLNLIVSIDTNYDGTYEDPLAEEDCLWTKAQKEKAAELAKLMYAKAPETLKDSLSNQMTALVAEYNAATIEDATWGKYKELGLVVKFETVNTYTNTSSLVEEFLDELQVLWDDIKAAGYLGQTLEAPLLSKEPFPTTYGYHHIAITGTTEVSKLAEKDAQFEIYQALLAHNEVKDKTYTFVEEKKNEAKAALDAVIEKYGKDLGYTLELANKANPTDSEKEALAEAKAEFLEKYGYDIDKAAFDEATQKLLTTYYDGAVKTIEEGDDMTNHTINFLKGKAFGFAENKDDRNSQLQFIVEVTEKQLAEDAEGGNN